MSKWTIPPEQRDQLCPIEHLRLVFEDYIKGSDKFKGNTPLGVMTVNGQFHHYMEPDTDTMWIGFALGYRAAICEHLEALTWKPLHAPNL